LGQINYARRFIANLAGKTKIFSPLLRLKKDDQFIWTKDHDAAFKQIKNCLSNPPVLISPKPGKPLRLYLSAADKSLGGMMTQENESGHEHAVFYLSRLLQETEQRYSYPEKVCLGLYDASVKLRHYFMVYSIQVVSSMDVMKYLLSQPLLKGRLSKWSMHLLQFELTYVSQRAIKGQAFADFLAAHPCVDELSEDKDHGLPWKLFFDGSFTRNGGGASVTPPYLHKPNTWPTT